mmetsp:Transcript_11928/g.27781  ORF Transcript_11928/g.27781 Transcript_11928/m.27781 type:complete len:251 (-) Transcript_11928:837-1589(-)
MVDRLLPHGAPQPPGGRAGPAALAAAALRRAAPHHRRPHGKVCALATRQDWLARGPRVAGGGQKRQEGLCPKVLQDGRVHARARQRHVGAHDDAAVLHGTLLPPPQRGRPYLVSAAASLAHVPQLRQARGHRGRAALCQEAVEGRVQAHGGGQREAGGDAAASHSHRLREQGQHHAVPDLAGHQGPVFRLPRQGDPQGARDAASRHRKRDAPPRGGGRHHAHQHHGQPAAQGGGGPGYDRTGPEAHGSGG